MAETLGQSVPALPYLLWPDAAAEQGFAGSRIRLRPTGPSAKIPLSVMAVRVWPSVVVFEEGTQMALSQSLYRNSDQRVGIFVDVQNMFYSARTLHQSKVDYSKLLVEMVNGRKLVRAIAYVVQKPDVDQKAFLEAVRRAGYEVKVKELAVRDDGSTRGDWDVGMTIDCLTMSSKLDTVVLVTGDGDFAPLADALKRCGCRVEVVSFEQSTSNELIRSCHEFIPIRPDVLFKDEKFIREYQERQYAASEEHGPARNTALDVSPDQ